MLLVNFFGQIKGVLCTIITNFFSRMGHERSTSGKRKNPDKNKFCPYGIVVEISVRNNIGLAEIKK